MKKIRICLMCVITLAVTVLSAVLLTGCVQPTSAERPTGQTKSVALLLGNHSCSKGLNLNSKDVVDHVTEAVRTYGLVAVISIDGNPDVKLANLYDIPEQYKQASAAKLQADADSKTKGLLASLSEVKADDPEVDTLEAIQLAVRTLGSSPEGSEKNIVIVDTGLSTTGLLDFRNNVITGSPSAIAEELYVKNAVPDMTGIHVIWLQLGDVAYPQQDLSPKQTSQLKEIWQAVIERGGGTFVYSNALSNNDIAENLPEVSVVNLQEEAAVMVPIETAAINFDEPQFLSEEQIRFIPDSADYLDPVEAETCISPIAEYMNRNLDLKILLAGTTAGDDNDSYTINLSKARADTVKNTMIAFGVTPERIYTIGLGSSDPWHIYGVGVDSDLASQNRKVVIMDASSQMAMKLLE